MRMDVQLTLYATRGANKAVARALGISDTAVSHWRKRGIPASRIAEVEAALAAHLATLAEPQQTEAA